MTHYQILHKITENFSFWYTQSSEYQKEMYNRAYLDGYDSQAGRSYELAKLSDSELIVYAHGYVKGSDDA